MNIYIYIYIYMKTPLHAQYDCLLKFIFMVIRGLLSSCGTQASHCSGFS